jgi:hypothetical protein
LALDAAGVAAGESLGATVVDEGAAVDTRVGAVGAANVGAIGAPVLTSTGAKIVRSRTNRPAPAMTTSITSPIEIRLSVMQQYLQRNDRSGSERDVADPCRLPIILDVSPKDWLSKC